MKHIKHWQDPVNGVLGVWLVLSPWIARFSGDTTATANMVIVGGALVAASLGAMLAPRVWEEWVEAALIICLDPALQSRFEIHLKSGERGDTGILIGSELGHQRGLG